jgi:hypothetical protein
MTSTEAAFSFTTKVNNDLFTVRGNTADEFNTNLTNAIIGQLYEKARALQDAISGTPTAPVTAPVAPPTVQQPGPVAPIPAPAAAPTGLEMVQDRWGNTFTYGHPSAPDLPDGRGKYIQKSGVSKAGKPYLAWVDPAKGPKPAQPGAVEAKPIYIN